MLISKGSEWESVGRAKEKLKLKPVKVGEARKGVAKRQRGRQWCQSEKGSRSDGGAQQKAAEHGNQSHVRWEKKQPGEGKEGTGTEDAQLRDWVSWRGGGRGKEPQQPEPDSDPRGPNPRRGALQNTLKENGERQPSRQRNGGKGVYRDKGLGKRAESGGKEGTQADETQRRKKQT